MKHHDLVDITYQKALEKLRANVSDFGLQAASSTSKESQKKVYTSLYPRDIGISSLGILESGDRYLIEALKASLINLTKSQSQLGQFPFYYKPEENIIHWRFEAGSIDSTLWWCITFLLYFKKTEDAEFHRKYYNNFIRAFTWLLYQDRNNDYLLEQGEAADWADEMPRRGTVLYTNAVWLWLLKIRNEIDENKDLKLFHDSVQESFNTIFWIHKDKSGNLNYIPKNSFTQRNPQSLGVLEVINSQAVSLPYYIGYICHKEFEMRCDTLGNLLAILADVADEKQSESILDHFKDSGMAAPYPIKALYPPIYPGDKDWREYMSKGAQNYPWQYHNGGIWPMVGGFYVVALVKTGRLEEAEKALEKLAELNAINDFEFNEYFHGQTGTPMGVKEQTWSMAMYIKAYLAVKKFKEIESKDHKINLKKLYS